MPSVFEIGRFPYKWGMGIVFERGHICRILYLHQWGHPLCLQGVDSPLRYGLDNGTKMGEWEGFDVHFLLAIDHGVKKKTVVL